MRYTNPISLTSQFFFCGLPLRLDSYRGCAFQCNFCFARYRGGNTPKSAIAPAEMHTLARRFQRSRSVDAENQSVVGQFLKRRCPIHFGGMSDPFQPAELKFGVTKQFLQTLADEQYPTVISTRSELVSQSPYIDLLSKNKNVVVQFSFVSINARVASRFEPMSSPPLRLLRAAERLREAGVNVTARWQPYLPRVSEAPKAFVRRVASAGVQHVALEHIKLPIEQNHWLWKQFSSAYRSLANNALDFNQHFARDGREFVLQIDRKLDVVLATRNAAHAHGITFGAADNELQYLSDTACCCSGVEQFPGFSNWFKHQIANAVRKCKGKRIVYGAISREWLPTGSVDRWLNSKTRIGGGKQQGDASLGEHIKHRWNSPELPNSPSSLYGVLPTDEFTDAGYRVYEWEDQLTNWLR